MLIELDPQHFCFVVLDNASAHSTPAILSFAAEHQDGLELVFLPTYSPHLNLIDRLRCLMRSQITRNCFYEPLNTSALAAVEWLRSLPFAQFCSLMGIDEIEMPFVAKPFS